MSAANTVDVAIVGGGPVGLAATVALRAAGFTVRLVERHPRPAFDPARTDPRVYALAPSSVRLLCELGAWPDWLAAHAAPYTGMRVWEHDPARALRFEAEREDAPLGWIAEHARVVEALWRQIEAALAITDEPQALTLPIVVDEPAVLRLASGATLHARLVVAADGADSVVRDLAGIEVERWAYAQQGIVCHIATEHAHRHMAWQRFLKTGPLAFLPCADGRCSIVWSADAALAAELLALDEAAFCARLGEASQSVLGTITSATPRLSFPLQALRVAKPYAVGLALIGDAVHVIHPLAGQGANLGFDDVRVLAETLVSARDAGRDWAGSRTLAAYARRRAADVAEMLTLTDALKRGFGTHLPGVRPLLGLGMGAVDQLDLAKRYLAARAARG